jgi:hypothetical protein
MTLLIYFFSKWIKINSGVKYLNFKSIEWEGNLNFIKVCRKAHTETNLIIAFDEKVFDELFFDVVVVGVFGNKSPVLQ